MSAKEAERIKVPWRNPCFVWWLRLQVRNAMSSTKRNQRWCFRQKITRAVFMAVKVTQIEKYFHPMVHQIIYFSSESGGRCLIPAFKVQSRKRWGLVWEEASDHKKLENMLKNMTQRAGIQPYCRNYSLKATTVTILSSVNVETHKSKQWLVIKAIIKVSKVTPTGPPCISSRTCSLRERLLCIGKKAIHNQDPRAPQLRKSTGSMVWSNPGESIL